MTENERLRVQMSTTLSNTLIAAAFAVLAGMIAAFVTAAEKIPGHWVRILGPMVVLPSLFLVASIYFGGRGISTAGRALTQGPENLPSDYDRGYFDRQAKMGLIGLILAILLLVCFGIGASSTSRGETKITNVGRSVVTSTTTILFDSNSSTVSPGGILQIRETVERARKAVPARIMVVGHTDAKGKAEYNAFLSRQRAEAAKTILRHFDLAADQVEVEAVGASIPLLTNANPEGRQHNRRVEIKIQY